MGAMEPSPHPLADLMTPDSDHMLGCNAETRRLARANAFLRRIGARPPNVSSPAPESKVSIGRVLILIQLEKR